MGKKSKPAAPPPPDYTALANQQAQNSQALIQQQTEANRPNITTPWGTQSWTKEGDQWNMNLTLTPEQQRALDSQMATQEGLSGLAQGLIGRVGESYKDPFSYEGLPEAGKVPVAGKLPEADAAERQRIENALFERMRPEHDRSTGKLETQLQNQGLVRGSEAWNREMERLSKLQAGERFNALSMGGEEMQRLFNMGMAKQGQEWSQGVQGSNLASLLRQQAIAERMGQRNQPLNELTALLSGQQVGNPQMPSFMGAGVGENANLVGAGQAQYQSSLDAYNAQMARRSGGLGSIGSIIGGVGGAFLGGPMGAMVGSNLGGGIGRGLY